MTLRRRLGRAWTSSLLAGTVAVTSIWSWPVLATPRRPPPRARVVARTIAVPVTLHISSRASGAVVAPVRIGDWIAHANEVMRPHGVELQLHAVEILEAAASDASRYAARRRLSRRAVDDGTLHVFVVDSLDRRRGAREERVRGMWWKPLLRPAGGAPELILVSRFATRETLAHEIGHALGLGHRLAADNLMCSCDRRRRAGLDPRQGRRLRAAAAVFAGPT